MSTHLSPEQLVALADGELDAAAIPSARAHLLECATCHAEAELLGTFDRVVRARAPAAEQRADPLPMALDQKLMRTAQALVASHGRPSRLLSWLRGGSLLLAAAMLGLVLGGVFWPEPTAITAQLRYTEGGVVRGPKDRTCHLELSLPRATHLWILRRDADGRLRLLLPDPNPVLAELEGDQPWPAGKSVRVPRDPLLDFAADWTGPATLFVVPTVTRMVGTAAEQALATLAGLANEAAVTAALRARFQELIVLQAR